MSLYFAHHPLAREKINGAALHCENPSADGRTDAEGGRARSAGVTYEWISSKGSGRSIDPSGEGGSERASERAGTGGRGRAPASDGGQSAVEGRTARSSLEFGARENSIQGRIERRRRRDGGGGGGREKRLPDGWTCGRRRAADGQSQGRSSKGVRE